MIKYRVWSKENQKFIYPVLDITNDFYSNYPTDKFTFDRLLFQLNGIDFYQNDIIISEYHESGKYKNKKLFLSILMSEDSLWRFDMYLYRIFKYEHLYPIKELMKYSSRHCDRNYEKIGNIHENFDKLQSEFEKYKLLKG